MTATASIVDLQSNRAAGLPATAPLASHQQRETAVMPGFNSASSWELAQRIAKAFSSSTLVPAQYQGNLANCLIALEMANRMGASPLQVMQNLYIVHGNPGWSSKFLIACFNQCGRFSALRYEFERDAKGKATGCRAWAVERATGEKLVGATITTDMANAEGWSTKSGSKWKTMPEQMLMYRAAAFFVRTYAPEISMGLRTADEIADGVIDAEHGAVMTLDELRDTTPGQPAAAIGNAPSPAVEFDPEAFKRKVRDCADPALLDLMADELRDLPEPLQAELYTAVHKRQDELAAG